MASPLPPTRYELTAPLTLPNGEVIASVTPFISVSLNHFTPNYAMTLGFRCWSPEKLLVFEFIPRTPTPDEKKAIMEATFDSGTPLFNHLVNAIMIYANSVFV